ncbi:hypothetical protein BGX29_001696 [Mortierella sp. GBA35]|nr:hypothetical protein BGX29_001696 [Mortierella sp. GBA35]
MRFFVFCLSLVICAILGLLASVGAVPAPFPQEPGASSVNPAGLKPDIQPEAQLAAQFDPNALSGASTDRKDRLLCYYSATHNFDSALGGEFYQCVDRVGERTTEATYAYGLVIEATCLKEALDKWATAKFPDDEDALVKYVKTQLIMDIEPLRQKLSKCPI